MNSSSEPGTPADDSVSQHWTPVGALKVGIIGQGTVGTATARLVAAADIAVVGYDRDATRVALLQADTATVPGWTVSDDSNDLLDADVIVIAVRISATSGGTDTSSIEQAFSSIAVSAKRHRLIVVETTLPPGETRRLAEQFLGDENNQETQVACCPERLREGVDRSEMLRTPRLAGGLTPAATRSACLFLSRIGVASIPVAEPEVAELSKLLENVFITTGIALMGEITALSHAVGISAADVAVAASSKPTGYYAFRPGAGIGGHCLPADLHILRNSMTKFAVNAPLIQALEASCQLLSPALFKFVDSVLQHSGIALKESRVCLVGVGFKVGSADTSNTAATEITQLLRTNGAQVSYSDAAVKEFKVDGVTVQRLDENCWPENLSAAVLLSGNPEIDLDVLLDRVTVVIDAGGGSIMAGRKSGVISL